MKQTIWILAGLLLALPALAQLQAQSLGIESLNNSKMMVVGNLQQPGGIQVKVVSRFVGEPAMYPFRLSTHIKCRAGDPFKVMDIGRVIAEKYPAPFVRNLGAPTKDYPRGQVQVCALDNVNFDRDKIFITVFEPGDGECDRSRVMDLMFAIQEFCER